MKVRWREHEILLVTMLAIILAAGFLWNLYNNTSPYLYESFTHRHFPFNIYRNVLIPHLGAGVLIYLSYLYVNYFIIPSFSAVRKQGSAKRYVWLFSQIMIIVLLLGTAINLAQYYKYEWKYVDHHLKKGLAGGYITVLAAGALFGLYFCLREWIIYIIERSPAGRAYLTLIANQVTAFLVLFIVLPVFAAVFHLVHDGQPIAAYFSFVLPVFLVYLLNVYWLFPLKKDHSFFRPLLLMRLLVSTLVCTIPFLFFPVHEGLTLAFLGCWMIQLFVVTPLTWLFYQLRKDKILQLKGIQNELVKSRTDLQFLRSQINPHFLFNVLNTLYSAALQENAERTAGGIQQLGDMMRFMLDENTGIFNALDKEIEYLKNYIALQRMRTLSSDEIVIEVKIDEHNCHHKIAPMLLIPLVENAFKHGISLEHRSWIKIKLRCTETEIVFEVRNSIHPQQKNHAERERYGIGHKNVLERLKLIYHGRHQLSVKRDTKEYGVSLVIIPHQ